MSNVINLYPQEVIANVSLATYSTDGDSGELDAIGFHALYVNVTTGNFSGGSSTFITLEGKGPDGAWVGISSIPITPNGAFAIFAGNGVPSGLTMFPSTIRIVWEVVSRGLTSVDLSYWVLGQA